MASAPTAGGVLVRVEGDLLDSDAEFIAQQCNCKTDYALGLAKLIFDRYKHADIYSGKRPVARAPGTVDVRGGGVDGRRGVLNMFGQYSPGKPKSARGGGAAQRARSSAHPPETRAVRKAWFSSCLGALLALSPRPRSIAFPHQIGCGLAGGDWSEYEAMLADFAAAMGPECVVSIVKLPARDGAAWAGVVRKQRGERRRGRGGGRGRGRQGRSGARRGGGGGGSGSGDIRSFMK